MLLRWIFACDFPQRRQPARLASQLRVGFFAQQHDLPAAGCRPDIDDDEEYSSYFWGAIAGTSRTGKPVENVDLDKDAKVSLAEAHAYAVIYSQTIDLPLRSTDALLREFSRIPDYDGWVRRSDSLDLNDDDTTDEDNNKLLKLTGSINSLLSDSHPIDKAIIEGLCKRLDISLDDKVSSAFSGLQEAKNEYRASRRSSGPGRRRGSFGRRRELREAIVAQWPELEDTSKWSSLSMLRGEEGAKVLEEIKSLPGYEPYVRSRDERTASRQGTLDAEMRQVLFQRLVHALETVVLAKNLTIVGTQATQERYHQMLKLENVPFQ